MLSFKASVPDSHISPRRILIIKWSSLGDIIHTLPAVNALRQRFPQSRLTWLVKDTWAPILEGNPDIDEVLSVSLSWNKWSAEFRTIRNGMFDVVLDFQGLLRSGIISALTGASCRVGFARAREGATWFYTDLVPLPGNKTTAWRLLEVHAVDRNLALTEFLGAKTAVPTFHLPHFSTDRVEVDGLLKDAGVQSHDVLIGLAPWTRSAIKAWPQERYIALASHLVQKKNVKVLLVGGLSEQVFSKGFGILNSGKLINLVGKLTLRQLPTLLRRLRLLIGNDSAPLHLAAGVGTSVLALFGPTHPKATGPFPLQNHTVLRTDLPCSPCGNRHCHNPRYLECLQSMPVEYCLQEVERILSGHLNPNGEMTFLEQFAKMDK